MKNFDVKRREKKTNKNRGRHKKKRCHFPHNQNHNFASHIPDNHSACDLKLNPTEQSGGRGTKTDFMWRAVCITASATAKLAKYSTIFRFIISFRFVEFFFVPSDFCVCYFRRVWNSLVRVYGWSLECAYSKRPDVVQKPNTANLFSYNLLLVLLLLSPITLSLSLSAAVS